MPFATPQDESRDTLYLDIEDPQKRIAQLAYDFEQEAITHRKTRMELQRAVLREAEFKARDEVEVYRPGRSYNSPYEWRRAVVNAVMAPEGQTTPLYNVRVQLKGKKEFSRDTYRASADRIRAAGVPK